MVSIIYNDESNLGNQSKLKCSGVEKSNWDIKSPIYLNSFKETHYILLVFNCNKDIYLFIGFKIFEHQKTAFGSDYGSCYSLPCPFDR